MWSPREYCIFWVSDKRDGKSGAWYLGQPTLGEDTEHRLFVLPVLMHGTSITPSRTPYTRTPRRANRYPASEVGIFRPPEVGTRSAREVQIADFAHYQRQSAKQRQF
jgi:hypothetical protein